MIEIKNLNISFGDKVILNNASFHTFPGVLTIIRGKSGSGKSTFLKTFQFAYECEYIYEGQRIDEQDQDSRQQFIYDHMVNVPQIPLFIEGMTIEEHIKQLVKLGYQRNDIYEEKFGIASLKKKYPRNLSGGEKTRVAIYLAIMSQPEILILDEPTAALDASYAIEMIKYLKEYAEEGHYVIVATHDKRMIEEADVLYKVDQTLILEKENKRETSLISQISHNHKLFTLRFSHRTFRIVMNILVAFTMIICAYSYNVYGHYNASYEQKINTIASRDLTVYKEKMSNDYYSYNGSEFPMTQSDYKKIKSVKNIESVKWRYEKEYNDVMILGLDTETQLKYQEAKLTGKKCNQTINLVSMQVYEDEDDYTNLTVKHNDNKGVYISNQLLSNQDISVDSINMDDLKLKFYLPIPMYDASGITQTGIDLEGSEYVDVNTVLVDLVEVELPVRGILKEGTEISSNSYSGTRSIYVPRSVINQYRKTYHATQSKVLYGVPGEEGMDYTYYEGSLPSTYTMSDVDQVVVETPWKPGAYTVRVDSLKNIDKVTQELEKLGFNVEGVFVDNSAINKLISNNQKVLIQFMIIVFVLLYGFYFYLKYLILKEEKQTRDFLYNLGFTTKRISKSFSLTYIKNSLILAVLGIVLLEVFIEFVIRIHIYSLIIPVTKMLILLFFTAAFIIEFFIPTLIQMIMKKSKGTVMNR
ncbi:MULTISPECIES: ATP-binding cassette domain-containing protein [Catenibacterium]|uniref:ATP-binding cassette domain-containing protein n=1 Tax=Catenibacterium TaxID=135858 RepID=UPI0024185038|nr:MULTISPECIES: ATP-binding cassette domain-containing protein [Catenibacterium]MEE0042190.1 ATP-binding cassette domain-containing protein [Catenibacterium sp.]